MRPWPVPFAVIAVAIACGSERRPPARDGGDAALEVSSPYVDTDGDGLCDDHEVTLGTNPLHDDSDADGYPDTEELILGARPTQSVSPPRDALVFLEETGDSIASHTVVVEVDGTGGDYEGAFENVASTNPGGLTAAAFIAGAEAVDAIPPGQVAAVSPEDQTFYQVVGETVLRFELSFAFGTNDALKCIRAFAFDYGVKRSDGRFEDVATLYLVVLPVGQILATGTWCEGFEGCV